jgi:hypothetical protein
MRSDAVSGALLVLVGAYAGYKAWGFGVGELHQPGAGFFPFIGAAMIVGCGAVIMARGVMASRPATASGETASSDSPIGSWKLWACVATLFGYAIALPLVGFALSTFVMLGLLCRLDSDTTWTGTLACALLGSAGFWLIFVRGLGVNFPPSMLGL